jgi:hypothetical protein
MFGKSSNVLKFAINKIPLNLFTLFKTMPYYEQTTSFYRRRLFDAD